jgi:hypothetical protein
LVSIRLITYLSFKCFTIDRRSPKTTSNHLGSLEKRDSKGKRVVCKKKS